MDQLSTNPILLTLSSNTMDCIHDFFEFSLTGSKDQNMIEGITEVILL